MPRFGSLEGFAVGAGAVLSAALLFFSLEDELLLHA
jgi:hypothetical protein